MWKVVRGQNRSRIKSQWTCHIVMKEGLPKTKCSIRNRILHNIWSQKISFELFHNIIFLLSSDGVEFHSRNLNGRINNTFIKKEALTRVLLKPPTTYHLHTDPPTTYPLIYVKTEDQIVLHSVILENFNNLSFSW